MTHKDKYELVSELARRRGFFWPSFEIYGGVGGYISYGPLGILLKERIIEKFRRFYLSGINAIEVDSPIIMPGKVFEASGHVEHFREPMMECSKCGRKFRLDHLLRDAGMSDTEAEKLSLQEMVEEIERRDIRCP
ncbi:MAG TPA: glycine--tRNA ligase, partial [Candidatus Bathyarchaeota archaeon]|nr:glycine--tRNA ligase [Candidatus Bathyarchaeota archaeon]